MLLKFHLTNPYSVAFVVFYVNSILFLLYSIEFLWYRLSMTLLSLIVHLLWLIMGALTSKGPASLCQLVAMSSMVWPINIRGVLVQLFMERWFSTYLFCLLQDECNISYFHCYLVCKLLSLVEYYMTYLIWWSSMETYQELWLTRKSISHAFISSQYFMSLIYLKHQLESLMSSKILFNLVTLNNLL